MRAACVNGFPDGIVLYHVQRVVFAAALGGLPLSGCTEKSDNRMLKPNLAFTTSNKSRQHHVATVSRTVPAGPIRIPVLRAVPKRYESKTAGLDLGTLVGLAPPAVDRILGRPAGMRTEAMSVEWTYIGRNCSLNIFFYPDIATGALRALRYNVTNMTGRGSGRPSLQQFFL